MKFLFSVKQTICRHYPRHHLVTASALGVLLVIVLSLTPEDSAHGDRMHLDTLVNQQALDDALAALRQSAGQSTESAESAESAEKITGIPGEPAGRAALKDPVSNHSSADQALRGDDAASFAGLSVTDSLLDSISDSIQEEARRSSAWTDVEVQSGDNLSSLFTQVGLSAQVLHRVINNSTSDAGILNRLHPGYQLSFYMPEPGTLEQLQVLTSPLNGYLFTLNEDRRYEVEPIVREAEERVTLRQGEIADSLFLAGQRAGIPTAFIMEMADIFGGVIDFILDPRQGDQFSLLYEEKFLNGELVGTGDIIGAQFINRGREYIALRYETEEGETGYFNPEGESMRKAFLRNPLDVFRISSNFNPNRRHPILNTIRAHRGTDYAAPTGTPVRATADGVVTWAARNGSFGKLVVIQHHGQFETKYAHLNGYAANIRRGSRVRQGQVIGYVGATGGATGPHLHYEFLVNGVHKDPRTIVDQLPQAISLEADEMERFREHTREALEQLSSQDNPTMLSLNSSMEHAAE